MTPNEFAKSSMAIETLIDLKNIMEKLSAKYPRHIYVIYLRFFANDTLADVAAKLGVRNERIRQIEAKALRMIRRQLQLQRICSFADAI